MGQSPGVTIIADFDLLFKGSYNRNATIFWYKNSNYFAKWTRNGTRKGWQKNISKKNFIQF